MEIELAVPAAEAWRVLAEQFGDIAQWSTSLLASRIDRDEVVEGCVRTCMGRGFGPFPPGEVTEELTRFDPDALAFTYVATSGLPGFVKKAMNRWTIEPLAEDRCLVRSHATLELAWWMSPVGPLMRWGMRSDVASFIEELKHRVEEGTPHPRKAAAMTNEPSPAAG